MTQFATNILTGKPVIATHITPTKEDLFECPECAMPLTYRQGSEKRCAHFAHPADTWVIFCSHRTDAPKDFKHPSLKKQAKKIEKLVELKHITEKEAKKVLHKVLDYIHKEWNVWRSQYKKRGYEIKELKEENIHLQGQIWEAQSGALSLRDVEEGLERWKKRCEKLEQDLLEARPTYTWDEELNRLKEKAAKQNTMHKTNLDEKKEEISYLKRVGIFP